MSRVKTDVSSMSFLEHSKDLRSRIIRSCLALFACFFALLAFSQNIVDFLSRPLLALGNKLYFFKVQEAMMTVVESCFWAAFIVSSPIWSIQILGFVLPALEKRQRKLLVLLFGSGILFLASGFAFSYNVIIPVSLKFLLGFSQASLEGMISIGFYLKYFLALFFMTGLIFQTPLVMLFLNRLGILDSRTIRKNRKIIIVIIFIIAAIVTPPDVVSQILIGLPMYALFELGAFLCFLFPVRSKDPVPEALDG